MPRPRTGRAVPRALRPERHDPARRRRAGGAELAALSPPDNVPLTWTYTVASGALPPGLSLDAATGVVSGTTAAEGSYSATFAVQLSTPHGSHQPRPASFPMHVGTPVFACQNEAGTGTSNAGVMSAFISQPFRASPIAGSQGLAVRSNFRLGPGQAPNYSYAPRAGACTLPPGTRMDPAPAWCPAGRRPRVRSPAPWTSPRATTACSGRRPQCWTSPCSDRGCERWGRPPRERRPVPGCDALSLSLAHHCSNLEQPGGKTRSLLPDFGPEAPAGRPLRDGMDIANRLLADIRRATPPATPR